MLKNNDMTATSSKTHWHAQPCLDVLTALGSTIDGLTEAEAKARLERHGPNALPEQRQRPAVLIFASQLINPLTFILFIAASVSLLLGERLDAFFICAVVISDMSLGGYQEWRAERNAASLKTAVKLAPNVIREGKKRNIDIEDIVPGDIVALESGVAVPADLRLVETNDLKIDEALLTGESTFVEKSADTTCASDAVIGDRLTMAFAGSLVTSGRGLGVVCATASDTELGRIARLMLGRGGDTPLLLRMRLFSRRIALLTVVLAAAIGLGQFLQGTSVADVFLITTALAVSAIPEGLPMAITVALSVASSRMGKRNVIVRHLPAVEALGSCTVIATDKTGTLTANRLTVRRIALPSGDVLTVEGEGLELEGAVSVDDAPLASTQRDAVRALARAGALTNEAHVSVCDGKATVTGDAVDVAFLVLAEKLSAPRTDLLEEWRMTQALPYEPEYGHSASVHQNAAGRRLISVKGAPEAVLRMCTDNVPATVPDLLHELTSNGYRVLAVAGAEDDDAGASIDFEKLSGLRFYGFVGLIDPIRSEAPAAVDASRSAGVDIRMITGDHPETALAIAQQISPSWSPESVITGKEMKSLAADGRTAAVVNTPIFARVEPAQKNDIVKILQSAGHFVAVTGDGVNDAPALKQAHVGVAMGAGGTDVARAASDLILTDDNFASIVAGIEEGRGAYDNIRKIVWLLISTAISEVTLFALALFAGLPIPITAVQILWLNLVTEGIQDVALAFEGKEPDLMRRPPRNPREPIFDRQMVEQCLMVGLYVGAMAFAMFYWLHVVNGVGIDAARNMVLVFLVLFNNFQTLNCRSETRSLLSIPLRSNPLLILSVIAAQAVHIAAMHIPLLQDILGVEPVSVQQWSTSLGLATSVLVIGEVYKAVRTRPAMRRLETRLQSEKH